MTVDQMIVLSILALALVLFAWGRLRYDMVALITLMLVVLAGVVPAQDAFSGFAHPAVITVAAILIISNALRESGLVDYLANLIQPLAKRPATHVTGITGLAALSSGFMNDIGALALFMPVAMRTAHEQKRSPGIILMPLAFGSILGGLLTLIGTPPNIIIANYRGQVTGTPFSLFDYTPVGIVVAAVGVAFVALIGWRLLPRRSRDYTGESTFNIDDYITELKVTDESKIVGQPLSTIEQGSKGDLVAVALIRDGKTLLSISGDELLKVGDLVLVEGDPSELDELLEQTGLEPMTSDSISQAQLQSETIDLVEAVIVPGSPLEGRSPQTIRRRTGYRVSMLALARQGKPLRKRLGKVQFKVSDLLLLQGESEHIHTMLPKLGCLPLAPRGLHLPTGSSVLITLSIFIGALIAVTLELTTISVAFVAAVVLMVLTKQISIKKLYRPVNVTVLILLGAMIPVGQALETTGVTELLVDGLLSLTGSVSPVILLILVMAITMTLSDIVNNAATAVIMAPIGATIAQALSVNPDTFLMAVAIAASCAFLTPIGHQCNMLVMGPGGYQFRDYWRMGLPLEILIIATATPMLLWVWPL